MSFFQGKDPPNHHSPKRRKTDKPQFVDRRQPYDEDDEEILDDKAEYDRLIAEDKDLLVEFPEDDDAEIVDINAVILVLTLIESHQRAINRERATLAGWLDKIEWLQVAWEEFQSAGGLTAEDFAQFIAGHFRHKRMRRKRHLRLVHSARCRPIRLHSRHGNDAA
jgi:hypothetical protein